MSVKCECERQLQNQILRCAQDDKLDFILTLTLTAAVALEAGLVARRDRLAEVAAVLLDGLAGSV